MKSNRAQDTLQNNPNVERNIPGQPGPGGYLAWHPVLGVVLVLLGLLIFSLLAFNVQTNGPLLVWDKPIDQYLHMRAIQDSQLDYYAMWAGSFFGEQTAIVLSVLVGLYWFRKRQWYKFSMLLIGVAAATLWFLLISHIIGRARPFFSDPIVSQEPGPGFPSGHAITSITFYGLILYLILQQLQSRMFRLVAILDTVLIIIVMGYSRLYFGHHYLTDILGGLFFGLAWGSFVYTSIELYHKHRSIRLEVNSSETQDATSQKRSYGGGITTNHPNEDTR